MSHCLILDIGKTNKKAFVFDEDYRIVFERSDTLPETVDDEGFPCEDINLLKNWILEVVTAVRSNARFQIKTANCSAYGASFVHLDADYQPVAPIVNYLKPFPDELKDWFLAKYGPAQKLSLETASPFLGHLNSGLQLLWLKHCKPLIFNKIKYSLHLPHWISFQVSQALSPQSLPTGQAGALVNPPSEMTSIGCHTMLWDFQKNNYHKWVLKEGIVDKFPVLNNSSAIFQGAGMHDSSSALLPYLACIDEPFILLSTGTWNIALNPFNYEPLTEHELKNDCLCYISHHGQQVKASRLFAGKEHEQAVTNLGLEKGGISSFQDAENFGEVGLRYLDFMQQLVDKQVFALNLVMTENIPKIFVDGGFSKNEIFMTLLAEAYPKQEVYAATVAQASALGAAVAIHDVWNYKPLPKELINMKRYFAR
jgi:sugar (pentulose or hexulose) kinase